MQAILILLTVFGALLAELGIGRYGVAAPVLATAVFYLATIYGWRRPFLPAVFAGAVLDATLGRHAPVSVLLVLPLALGLAQFWRHEGICRYLMVQMLPGAFLGLFQAAVLLTAESFLGERFFWGLLRHNLWAALQLMVGGMVALPLVCGVLDRVARRLALPRYQEIQEQRSEHGV